MDAADLEGVNNNANDIGVNLEGVDDNANDIGVHATITTDGTNSIDEIPNNVIHEEGIKDAIPPQEFHASGRPKCMHRRHTKDTTDGNTYVFTTEARAEAYGINNETPTLTAFLHAQTEYVNSLHTYSKVNTAIQHACEHLVLTQLGMKAGIKLWGQPSVEAIIKEMKQFNDRKVVRPLIPSEITTQVKAKSL